MARNRHVADTLPIVVPEPRFELGRPCEPRSLSPLRLPFRHSGRIASVAEARGAQGVFASETDAPGPSGTRVRDAHHDRGRIHGQRKAEPQRGRLAERKISHERVPRRLLVRQRPNARIVSPWMDLQGGTTSGRRRHRAWFGPGSAASLRRCRRARHVRRCRGRSSRRGANLDSPYRATAALGRSGWSQIEGRIGPCSRAVRTRRVEPAEADGAIHEETGPKAGFTLRLWRRRPDSNR